MGTLRLTRILQEQRDLCGSTAKLAEAIRKADDGENWVDPRKPTEIIKGRASSLRVSDLKSA